MKLKTSGSQPNTADHGADTKLNKDNNKIVLSYVCFVL